MKKLVPLIVLILCGASFWCGRCSRSAIVISASECETIDIITTEDTVADLAPALSVRDSVIIHHQYVTVPIMPPPVCEDSCSAVSKSVGDIAVISHGDSAELAIPIVQKKYETGDYRAYVSGYNPSLDSLYIKRKSTTVRLRNAAKPKHFSVGLQGGYGMTPKGFQPYIGVGIAVNIFSF